MELDDAGGLGPTWGVIKSIYIDVTPEDRDRLPEAVRAACEFWLNRLAKGIISDGAQQQNPKSAEAAPTGGRAGRVPPPGDAVNFNFGAPPRAPGGLVEGVVDSPLPARAPASDRIVTLDHNQPGFRAMVGAIERVEHEVRGTNDLPPEFDRERVVAELQAGLRLLKANPIRLSPVESLLANALRYVVENANTFALGMLASLAATALTAVVAFFLTQQ